MNRTNGATKKKLVPKCDFCARRAKYDTKTVIGPWAHVCQTHFEAYSTKEEGMYSQLASSEGEFKLCYLCNEVKPIAEYYHYKDARGVLRSRNECKSCNLQERKKRSFR